MPKQDDDSYLYIQGDYSLDSDFDKSPSSKYNSTSNKLEQGFNKSTPRLNYSGSINSCQNNKYLNSIHSTPQALVHQSPNSDLSPFSRSEFSIPPYPREDLSPSNFSNPDYRITRERSYVFPSAYRSGRSSTCNVTIPIELDQCISNSPPNNHSKFVNTTEFNTDKTSNTNKNPKIVKELESQNMEDKTDEDNLLYEAGRDLLLAPEFASDERTRRFLSLSRELYVAIIGCQVVYILTSLMFGNAPLSIIVTLLMIQSCFCHADGRPVAYIVNAFLSLAINITIIIALAQDISGLEPFRTEPVLKTLSYVYIPICFLFTALSVFLAFGFRRLRNSEKKTIINATNNLLGKRYHVDQKHLTVKPN
uniref:Integral membrane protein, putative n=1 Tax=Theileria annulata TaxID=5874 RepID=A0A3B0N5R4_THEAN